MAEKQQDRTGTAAAADLRPLDPPEGQGQTLAPEERARLASETELAAARRQADEEYARVQAEIRARHASAVGKRIEETRQAALSDVAQQREALRGNMPTIAGIQVVNPAFQEIEGSLVRAEAAALELDETVPGGTYIVNGRLRDAHDNDLGPAPR
jgi:hypothetical protein